MSDVDVSKSQVVELNGLSDLIRLIISNSNQRGGFLYLGEKNGRYLFYISHVVPSWYDLKGLPVVLYAYVDTMPDENFIEYTPPTSVDSESWKFVNTIQENNPKIMYIPIVRVAKIPSFTF